MKVDIKVTIKIGDQKLTLTENEAKDLRSELNRIFAPMYTPEEWKNPTITFHSNGSGSTGSVFGVDNNEGT